MSVFYSEDRGGWVSKFQYRKKPYWTKGGAMAHEAAGRGSRARTESGMGIGKVSKCAAFVAIALLATGGGVAAAHTFDAESRVTMHYKAEKERFQGRVTSDGSSCLRDRTVVIYRQTPAEDPAGGMVVTNRNGFWKAQEVVSPEGAFYARVLRRVRTPDGHRHLCEADRSRTLDLGGSRALSRQDDLAAEATPRDAENPSTDPSIRELSQPTGWASRVTAAMAAANAP